MMASDLARGGQNTDVILLTHAYWKAFSNRQYLHHLDSKTIFPASTLIFSLSCLCPINFVLLVNDLKPQDPLWVLVQFFSWQFYL